MSTVNAWLLYKRHVPRTMTRMSTYDGSRPALHSAWLQWTKNQLEGRRHWEYRLPKSAKFAQATPRTSYARMGSATCQSGLRRGYGAGFAHQKKTAFLVFIAANAMFSCAWTRTEIVLQPTIWENIYVIGMHKVPNMIRSVLCINIAEKD